MAKRVFALVMVSGFLSAGLLFIGTMLMGKFTPALAFSPNALVAGTNAPTLSVTNPAEEKVSDKKVQGSDSQGSIESNSAESTPTSLSTGEATNSVQPTSVSSTKSDNSVEGLEPSTSVNPSIKSVTIAQLLKHPDQFIHQLITVSGISTVLESDKFLLNDGTGQILVEIEDHLVSGVVLNGLSISVTGEFDDSIGQKVYKLDAYSVKDVNGKPINHDCTNDDCSDDCVNDDCADDCANDNCADDCPNDNCADDCANDNCADDCANDNCTDDCANDNCAADCATDNCSDDCINDNCSDDCKNDDCQDDSADEAKDKMEDQTEDSKEEASESEDDK